MEKQTIDCGATEVKYRLGPALIGHIDFGFFMEGASGPVRLDGNAWKRFCDRAFGFALNAKERRAAPLDDEDRRKFLSSAGYLCGHGGRLCPSCREEAILSQIGIKSLTELNGK